MIKTDRFVNAAVLLTAASIFSSAINYILQIFYSHNFSIENFGIFNAVNALTLYYTFFASPLANKIIMEVSTFSDNTEKLKAFLYFSRKNLFICICLLSIPSVMLMLGIGLCADLPVLFVLSIVLLCLIGNRYIIFQGFLQGLHLFYRLAFITFLLPIIRFLVTYTLFYIGFDINAVFIFIVVFAIITCILYYVFLPKQIKIKPASCTLSVKEFSTKTFYKNFIRYILQTGIIYLLFYFMMQSDTLLIKFFFSGYDTGVYSSASVFGKAIVFLSGAVTIVLFPHVAKNTADNKSSLPILLKGIFLNLLIAGSGTLVLFIFPQMLIMFFGEKYQEAIPIIKYIGAVFLPLSMLNILFTFYLAKKRFDCFIPLFAAFITEILCIVLFHNSLMQALLSFFIGGIVGCIGFVLLELVNILKRKST
ncbi:hypothetical protein [Treponema putidum]|uniref:O-antigen/teichoic acid export membrane protein n=1 Tax=Treponema putidum TaxID=221027 RepID=A0ABY5HVQ2_9SPIR|nr:hypothetical protein [Treponema putidum]UTY28303.1 hypothetical protein E4N76_04405 [Treponema putidum]